MSEIKEGLIGNPYRIYELPSLQCGEVIKLVYARDGEVSFKTIFIVLNSCRLTRKGFEFVFYITAMAVIFDDDTLVVKDGGLLTNEIEIYLNDYRVVHPSHQDIDRINRVFVTHSCPLSVNYKFV